MKEINRINFILDKANEELKLHAQYQDWMHFDGADVTPHGQIIPRVATQNGKGGLVDAFNSAYEETWKTIVDKYLKSN
jgi:hypothetical protein